MADKKMYRVVVTEILRKTVVVEAGSAEEAHRRVSDAWQNGEYLLDGKDSDGAEFYVAGEWDGEEGDKDLDWVDGKYSEVPCDGI